jgi:hypothetical protein
MAGDNSFLSTDERILLSTLRAQLIRCSVLTLPNEEQERLAPAGRALRTPHVDIDCTLTSDEEQGRPCRSGSTLARSRPRVGSRTTPASPSSRSRRRRGWRRRLDLDSRVRARPCAEGSRDCCWAWRRTGAWAWAWRRRCAARVVSDSEGDSNGDDECNSDASEGYVPAKMSRLAVQCTHARNASCSSSSGRTTPSPSRSRGTRDNLLGYTDVVDAFVGAWKAEGKIWPPPSTRGRSGTCGMPRRRDSRTRRPPGGRPRLLARAVHNRGQPPASHACFEVRARCRRLPFNLL